MGAGGGGFSQDRHLQGVADFTSTPIHWTDVGSNDLIAAHSLQLGNSTPQVPVSRGHLL